MLTPSSATHQPLHPPKRGFGLRVAQLSGYSWILLAQCAVLAVYASVMPLWLIGYGAVVIALQLPLLRPWLPKFALRPRALQFLQYVGFIAGLLGLYATYRTAIGLEVGLAFLLLCALSKLLELNTRRDGYVVLCLALFVLAGRFLLDQGLSTTLAVAAAALLNLFAMIAQNDDGTGRYRTLWLLLGQALPLLVVLFLFFPRLPPLWSVQLGGQNQATTGMSDSMSPGDFASLSQSTELAFRAEFTGAPPPQAQLYWRGLVFDAFDGKTWRPSNQPLKIWAATSPAAPANTPDSSTLRYNTATMPSWLLPTVVQSQVANQPQTNRYRVILERTGQPWLFALDYPLTSQRGIGLTSNFTLRYWDNVNQRLVYQVQWLNDAAIGQTLAPRERQQDLQLPADGNPQSRQFARDLFAQSGNDPIAFSQNLARWIRTQSFRYTLSPPALGANRIDEFLFGTRAGFCEHYSSSFVFLMRSVGVPARVVAGYQGGQLGRDGKSWEVRQMDAHAWAEIWVEGRGWLRVDPTAFVAPERVEQGMDRLTQTAGAQLFGDGAAAKFSYRQFQMLQQARRLFDQAGYYWQRNVVGYDQDRQKSSLLKWFSIQSVYQQVMWMAALLVLLLAIFGLWLWWRRRKHWDKADKIVVDLSARLAKHDSSLARQPDEGALAYLTRLESVVQQPKQVREAAAVYRKLRYAAPDSEAKTQSHSQLKNLLKTIKSIN